MRRSKTVKMAKKALNKAYGSKKDSASKAYLSAKESYKQYREEKRFNKKKEL